MIFMKNGSPKHDFTQKLMPETWFLLETEAQNMILKKSWCPKHDSQYKSEAKP